MTLKMEDAKLYDGENASDRDQLFQEFCREGKADFIIGGQWGSEGKGAAAAALARRVCERSTRQGDMPWSDSKRYYDIMTTNAGAQAGHTSTHKGRERVVFHLPTAALIQHDIIGEWPTIYINAGAIIEPNVLLKELFDNKIPQHKVIVHPNAAIITPECQEAEGRADSGQTKIASTRKGVGEALARKVLRTGRIARDEPSIQHLVDRLDLNDELRNDKSVLVEVPQGLSLSINSQFYPYTTSRNCTIQQAMSDANAHPHFMGATCLVLRTFPIRVGNIVEDGKTLGTSGAHFPDQDETDWGAMNKKPEITTVTKRVRRVFTFSWLQGGAAIKATRPDTVFLTFCDYFNDKEELERWMDRAAQIANEESSNLFFEIIGQFGPTTDDHKLLGVLA